MEMITKHIFNSTFEKARSEKWKIGITLLNELETREILVLLIFLVSDPHYSHV